MDSMVDQEIFPAMATPKFTAFVYVTMELIEKIPHTGDKESLDRCG